MAHYINTKAERETLTNLEVSHLDYLNKRQKEYVNNIVPEIMDTRTKHEKLKNKDYINQQIRRMAYNLFDDDPKFSELFIQLFFQEKIDYSPFSIIYDELLNRVKGTDARAPFVIKIAKQLIKNIKSTGSTNSTGSVQQAFSDKEILKNLNQLKADLATYHFDNSFLERETKEKLNAMNYLYNNVFSQSSNISFIDSQSLTTNQFKVIKTNISLAVSELIKILVSNDLEEDEKQLHVMKILNSVKDESLRTISKFIQEGKLIIHS